MERFHRYYSLHRILSSRRLPVPRAAIVKNIRSRQHSSMATVIAKRGHVVANIVPAKEPVWDRSAVRDEAEALRKKLKIKGRFRIVDLIAAGRL